MAAGGGCGAASAARDARSADGSRFRSTAAVVAVDFSSAAATDAPILLSRRARPPRRSRRARRMLARM
jgi:hypothetical protein